MKSKSSNSVYWFSGLVIAIALAVAVFSADSAKVPTTAIDTSDALPVYTTNSSLTMLMQSGDEVATIKPGNWTTMPRHFPNSPQTYFIRVTDEEWKEIMRAYPPPTDETSYSITIVGPAGYKRPAPRKP